jgi:hypothetical protein
MGSLVREGCLTIREASERIASAIFCAQPDQPNVARLRELGFDVADGQAREEAISKIWAAVDNGKIQAFVVGPRRDGVLKRLTSTVSKGIPLLRSRGGGDLRFFRPSNEGYDEFARWFGPDLSMVSVIFREAEIGRLVRCILQSRRRKLLRDPVEKRGRPSRQIEVESVVCDMVLKRKWCSTQSLKALTLLVNRHGKWLNDVSEDTVERVLTKIYKETGDRRFERVRRTRRAA